MSDHPVLLSLERLAARDALATHEGSVALAANELGVTPRELLLALADEPGLTIAFGAPSERESTLPIFDLLDDEDSLRPSVF